MGVQYQGGAGSAGYGGGDHCGGGGGGGGCMSGGGDGRRSDQGLFLKCSYSYKHLLTHPPQEHTNRITHDKMFWSDCYNR